MKKVLSVFLSILMLASVFACLTISASADSYGRVPYLNITVTAPAAGAKPVFDATVTSEYDGQVSNSHVNSIEDMINGVQWYDQTAGRYLGRDDTFVAGHTYNVGVLVTVGTVGNDQFRFKKDNPPSWCKVNGNDAQGDYYFGDSGYAENDQYYYVHYTFPTLPKNGWFKEDTGWHYYYNSEALTGWQKLGSNWYYFDADGIMKTGWQKLSGKWYYFGGAEDGKLRTGWQKINSKWYYFGGADSGAMRTGWQKINNKWYYFGGADDGVMKTGWQKINNKWYYFGGADDGVMKTGWQKISSKWYYFGGADDGVMKTGWVKSNGKWYYMDANGAMLANTSRKIGNKTYKFNSSGVCTNP